MKIKQLIEELKFYNPEMEVKIQYTDIEDDLMTEDIKDIGLFKIKGGYFSIELSDDMTIINKEELKNIKL